MCSASRVATADRNRGFESTEVHVDVRAQPLKGWARFSRRYATDRPLSFERDGAAGLR